MNGPMPRKPKVNPLPHTIVLVIGDWSRNGHEKSETVAIRSNLSRAEIEAAYAAGVKVIGVDVRKTVAAEYEDPYLYEPEWNKYVAAGIADLGWDIEGVPDGTNKDGKTYIRIFTEAYVDLYLFTVLRGNPTFKYEFPAEGAEQINIGGYGLFYR